MVRASSTGEQERNKQKYCTLRSTHYCKQRNSFDVIYQTRDLSPNASILQSNAGRRLHFLACWPSLLYSIKGELRWEGHTASDRRFWAVEAPTQTAQNDLKSTYCFCAHMHEITKYFLFTENQQQCALSGLRRSFDRSESSIWSDLRSSDLPIWVLPWCDRSRSI